MTKSGHIQTRYTDSDLASLEPCLFHSKKSQDWIDDHRPSLKKIFAYLSILLHFRKKKVGVDLSKPSWKKPPSYANIRNANIFVTASQRCICQFCLSKNCWLFGQNSAFLVDSRLHHQLCEFSSKIIFFSSSFLFLSLLI